MQRAYVATEPGGPTGSQPQELKKYCNVFLIVIVLLYSQSTRAGKNIPIKDTGESATHADRDAGESLPQEDEDAGVTEPEEEEEVITNGVLKTEERWEWRASESQEPGADEAADTGDPRESSGANEADLPEEWTIPSHMDYPFASVNLGGIYFHPLGDISGRHQHGGGLHIQTMFWGERFGGGLDIQFLFSAGADGRIVVPAGYEGNAEPEELELEPAAIHGGILVQYLIIKKEHLLLSVGLGFGFMGSHYNFKGKDIEEENQLEDYKRSRLGIYGAEYVELAYMFNEVFGLYLRLGLAEGYSWNDDGVQPDLGRRDNTEYGLELWPTASGGLRLQKAFPPLFDPETSEMLKKRSPDSRFFQIDLALGYGHPLGRISERHPPGLAMISHWLLRMRKLEFGLFISLMASGSGSDHVVLSAESEDNPSDRPMELESNPASVTWGFVFNPFVLARETLLISAGIHLGMAYHHIGRGSKTDSSGDQEAKFKDYRRERLGIVFGQHVDLSWFVFSDEFGTVGLILRLSIDETYTWSLKKKQPDLGGPDLTEYGIELWPSVTGGIIVLL